MPRDRFVVVYSSGLYCLAFYFFLRMFVLCCQKCCFRNVGNDSGTLNSLEIIDPGICPVMTTKLSQCSCTHVYVTDWLLWQRFLLYIGYS